MENKFPVDAFTLSVAVLRPRWYVGDIWWKWAVRIRQLLSEGNKTNSRSRKHEKVAEFLFFLTNTPQTRAAELALWQCTMMNRYRPSKTENLHNIGNKFRLPTRANVIFLKRLDSKKVLHWIGQQKTEHVQDVTLVIFVDTAYSRGGTANRNRKVFNVTLSDDHNLNDF